MKKFLEDLKKELVKMKLNKNEINEILADHEEMIDQATKEGLSEEEITAKFGEPAKIAKELGIDYYINEGVEEMDEGYVLFKSFPVIDELKEVEIKLISEDVEYQEHNQESIEVYFKNIDKTGDYECEYKDCKFVLRRESKLSFRVVFRNKNKSVIIKVPKGHNLDKFRFNSVSGDVECTNIISKELKFRTVSGDVEVKSLEVVNGLVKTVSGDAEILKLKADTFKLSSVSGDLELFNGKIEGEFEINTVSGDLDIHDVEAGETTYSSVSGDLEGKNFYPSKLNLKSVSGDIEVHNEDRTRDIEIGRKKTISGDITIN